MRFKLTIEYAGTRYSGWQIQKNARDGAGRDSSARSAPRPASATSSCTDPGRTDAGVHALAQVAHLDHPQRLCRPRRCVRRINDELPSDINILLGFEKVRHTFHARHDARGRSYIYQVARRRTAFAKPFVWWVKEDLDLATHACRRDTASSASTTSARSPTTTRSRSRRRCSLTSLEIHEDGTSSSSTSRARTSSGRWCGASSASSSKWGAVG